MRDIPIEKADVERYGAVLLRAPLFGGFDETSLERLLEATGARVSRRARGEYFIMQGDERPDVFVVVEGRAAGESVTAQGAASTVNEFVPGDEFGDLLSGSREHSPVSVVAQVSCAAVRLSFERLFSASGASAERALVVRNLVAITAEKYFSLSRRVSLLLEPRLRRRAAGYLLALASQKGSDSFSVPHDREGMARYLGCERSALSRELSRMKRDGLIDCCKAAFKLLDREALEGLWGK